MGGGPVDARGGRRAEEADCRAVGLGYQDGAPGGGAGDGAGAPSGVATPVIWIGGVRRSSSGCGRIVD